MGIVFKVAVVFFVLLFLPFVIGAPPNVRAGFSNSHASTSQATEGTPLCDQSMSAKVQKAAKGMSLESVLLVGNAVTGAVSATEDAGGAASIAHKGQGAIQTAIMVAATKRAAECEAAISECESACEAEIDSCKVLSSPPEHCNDNQTILTECQAESSTCSEAALAALVAGIQAATSFLTARQLEECEDGKCEEEVGDEDELELPNPPGLGGGENPPPPEYVVPPPVETKGGGEGTTVVPPEQEGGEEGGDNPKARDKKIYGNGGSNGNGLSGSTLTAGSGSSSKPSGSLPSGGFSTDSATGGLLSDGEEEEDDDDHDEDRMGGYSPRRVAGGSSGGSYKRTGGGRDPYNRGFGGPRNLAAANEKDGGLKKNALKRDIFGRGGVHDNIFEKMSRIIQSYCAKGGEKCH